MYNYDCMDIQYMYTNMFVQVMHHLMIIFVMHYLTYRKCPRKAILRYVSTVTSSRDRCPDSLSLCLALLTKLSICMGWMQSKCRRKGQRMP